MKNKTIKVMKDSNWIDSSFEEELLEFTKANQVEKERAVQKARSKGGGQKEVDKERKKADRKKETEGSSPWKRVIIVKTNQDGKIRLIPKSDFNANKHELLYGEAPGQPPKPEVTPNVAQEMSTQDDFEASKTSNRLLGVVKKKKREKSEIVRSDHYDYPKDGIERKDSTSTYPDWDHAPESLAGGISLVANSTGGKQVDMKTISQFFGQSQTLMDASIRAYQQIGEKVKGSFLVTTAEESYPVSKTFKKILGDDAEPVTDLIVQDQTGTVYNVAIIYDNTKIIVDDEANLLFQFSLQNTIEKIESNEKVKKQLEKLKEKVVNIITNFDNKEDIQRKYILSNGENIKRELISSLESLLESNDDMERFVVLESLTGSQKFEEGSPAIANTLMSTSRDGTNLKFTPLNEVSINRLLGETELKLRLFSSVPNTPFDEMYGLLANKTRPGQALPSTPESSSSPAAQNKATMQPYPSLNEYFTLLEDQNDAKLFFEQHMSQSPSILIGLLTFFGLSASNIVIRNINLDAVGSISNGDFTTVSVGNQSFYIDVEKDVEYYDSNALRLGEERDYKKEYREYHGTEQQKKRRAGRNHARREAEKNGQVEKGDGKDIDHKDHNPLNNSSSNTRVRSKSANRGDNKVPIKEEHGAGEEGTDELLLRYIFDTPYMTIPAHLLKKRKSRK
tara:strand:- start:10922 stop:12955 length:2034 start_codon:yes stop_codon:yes gene_type:complete